MSFTDVNYLAVIIATLAGFGLGPVWYTVLAKLCRQDRGRPAAKWRADSSLRHRSVALFVMALMLAG